MLKKCLVFVELEVVYSILEPNTCSPPPCAHSRSLQAPSQSLARASGGIRKHSVVDALKERLSDDRSQEVLDKEADAGVAEEGGL
jgi:hypothetical protein